MNRREFVAGSGCAALPRGCKPGAGTCAGERVRVLVFDTFGTVVDWRGSVIAEGERLGQAKGLKIDWAEFADAWRGGYGPAMNRVRKGEVPWTKLDVLHRRIARPAARTSTRSTTCPRTRKGTSTACGIDSSRGRTRLQGLTRLKKRFVIAPLSNGNLSLLTNMAKHAGLPWDCMLSTELVRRYKPDPETYLMAGGVLRRRARRGHDGRRARSDLEAAKKLGLQDGLRARPLEFGPARTPSRRPRQVRFMARDFRELATTAGNLIRAAKDSSACGRAEPRNRFLSEARRHRQNAPRGGAPARVKKVD